MPLINFNVAKEMGYGMKAMSNGIEYTVVAHIGGTMAVACKAADKFPAPIYLIEIDLKTEAPEEPPGKEGGNGGQQPTDKTPAPGKL